MRTAVVRVRVDPAGGLTPDQLSDGMTALRALVDSADVEVVENNIAAMPAGRREVPMGDRSIDAMAARLVRLERETRRWRWAGAAGPARRADTSR